jgi:hypothetical protein
MYLKAMGEYSKFLPQPGNSGKVKYCSRSRQRAEKVDKSMALVHTHGLFIT